MGIFGRTPRLSRLNARLGRLSAIPPIAQASPHQPLARDIWLSTEEGAGAELAISGGAGGLTLDLKTIGRSDWLSLSFRVPHRALRSARYLVLIVRTRADGFVSYRPCLRYVWPETGFEDHFARDYVVTSGGEDEQLSYLPIEADPMARARHTEVHLFFQGTEFRVDLARIETVLIA